MIEQHVEIFAGGVGVAQVELYGLALTQFLADGEKAPVLVHMYHVAHQIFAGFKVDLELGGGDADVQGVTHALLVFRGQRPVEGGEDLERGLPIELV